IVPVIGGVCLLALGIGTTMPTQIIVGQVYSPSQKTNYLGLFDTNRNLPIYLNYPVDASHQFMIPTPSPNGRRFIILSGTFDSPDTYISVWDIFMGRVFHLDNIVPNCNSMSGEWLENDQLILFFCWGDRRDGRTDGMYILNFDTGELDVFDEQYYPISQNHFSPDLQNVAINIRSTTGTNTINITHLRDNTKHAITPDNRFQQFIAWENEGESVLAYGIDSIQRYSFATQTWDVLLDNLPISQPLPNLSPNKDWLIIFSGIAQPRPYLFNIKTLDLIPFEDDFSEVSWSPNSQWMVIQIDTMTDTNYPLQSYYLFDLDTREAILLSENVTSYLVWSEDNSQVFYTVYQPENDTTALVMSSWNSDTSAFDSTTIATGYQIGSVALSPDEDSLAFVLYDGVTTTLHYYTENRTIRQISHARDTVGRIYFIR
ncbi:MAG: hypothetical protein KJ043_12725, partial [Anaerolineae bacterium]|nr:hypothetical protein [Anaerolineae bacterium]